MSKKKQNKSRKYIKINKERRRKMNAKMQNGQKSKKDLLISIIGSILAVILLGFFEYNSMEKPTFDLAFFATLKDLTLTVLITWIATLWIEKVKK